MLLCSLMRVRAAALTLIAVALLAAPAAEAKQVSFVRDYSYQASEVDSKLSCRAVALEQVKRLLLEEVGTFVQSESTVRDFRLSKDEVVTMAAGIVSVEILKEQWDGVRYALTARVEVDPKQVAEALDHLRGNNVEREELEASRKKAEEAIREVQRLRKELAALRSEAKPAPEQTVALKRKEEEYSRGIADIRMQDLLQKGVALLESGNNEAALQVFDDAVKADPAEKRAWLGRGSAYARLDKTTLAFKDIDKAIELDPKFAKAYRIRGRVLRKLGKFSEAIREQNKAIELNADFAEAYFERGLSYRKIGERQRGTEDLKRAANMGFKKAQEALSTSGIIY